jgi:hypothetical protein
MTRDRMVIWVGVPPGVMVFCLRRGVGRDIG